MSRQKIIFIPISICVALAIFVSTPGLSAGSNTYWLIVDATPEARAHEVVNTLIELLTTRGKVPSEQIHHVEGDSATSEDDPCYASGNWETNNRSGYSVFFISRGGLPSREA